MRETRTSGSEGGEPQANGTSLPLSVPLAHSLSAATGNCTHTSSVSLRA
jgi:hypothetical protein